MGFSSKRSNRQGFTLIELTIVVCLIGIIMYGISTVLVKTSGDQNKLAEDIVNTADQTVFQQLVDGLGNELGPSIDFFHLPIPVACSGGITTTACVRRLATDGFYYTSGVTFNGVTPPHIEFFKDEYTSGSSNALVGMDPTGGGGGLLKVLKNDLVLSANQIPDGANYYATWLLENEFSPHFTALAYAKESQAFILENLSMTNDTAKIMAAQYLAFYKEDPPLPTQAMAQALLNTLKNRPVLVQNSNNAYQHFLQILDDAQACTGSDCNPQWAAYNGSGTYPTVPTPMPISGTPSDKVVAIKLKPVQASQITSFESITSPISANYSAVTGDQSQPFYFATEVSAYYMTDNFNNRLGDYKNTGGTTSDLIQKFGSVNTSENLVVTPIEIISIYLEKSAKWTATKPSYRLMKKVFRANGQHIASVLTDNIPGFVMIQRKLGSDAEFLVSVFNKKVNEVIKP